MIIFTIGKQWGFRRRHIRMCFPKIMRVLPAEPFVCTAAKNWLEFWFLFLHILNGRMATLPQTLPRSFRDLHFCFRESKFKTRASASFRAVDFFSISLEVLPRSHRELPRKLFLGVAWKCVICICWWAGHSDNVFGCTGWRVKNTYYIKVIHSDFELHRWHIHVTF